MAILLADVYITYLNGDNENCLEKQRELDAYIMETAPYTDNVLDDVFLRGDYKKYLRIHNIPTI
jgi:hypothetical protein